MPVGVLVITRVLDFFVGVDVRIIYISAKQAIFGSSIKKKHITLLVP